MRVTLALLEGETACFPGFDLSVEIRTYAVLMDDVSFLPHRRAAQICRQSSERDARRLRSRHARRTAGPGAKPNLVRISGICRRGRLLAELRDAARQPRDLAARHIAVNLAGLRSFHE